MHYLYMIKCKSNYLYTGITWNIAKRLKEHNSGECRNTKNRFPAKLVYSESFKTSKEAAKREKEIKGWSRKKKISLIESSLHWISLH